MASDMDLEQQEREEELKRLEEDVKNSDVALDKLNSEYEEQMDEMAEEPEQEHGKVWIFFGKLCMYGGCRSSCQWKTCVFFKWIVEKPGTGRRLRI